MSVPDSAAFLCYDCKHEFVPAEIVQPLRIFLSYGHDANEPLVRRIKADLEKRGHEVWFDKTPEPGKGIRAGDNWREAITDGILRSHRFVSFLSKHSTRDPGVCRDEIAIALGVKGGNIQTILVESEADVQPPVSISHVQWLDMHDWKEAHGTVRAEEDQPVSGDAPWEDWYQAQLAEIIRIVESDESRRFVGEIETLNTHLKPIKSDARIYDLLRKGFYGREWLFGAVENWRLGIPPLGGSSDFIPHPSSFIPSSLSRLFWITGDPGVGKSAFAAQLTHTRSDAVIAAQFVQWHDNEHRDARNVVRSLAFQLATRLPDYRKLLRTLPEIAELDRKNADELFDYLLVNPLRSVIGGGRERQLIVIDALDEAGDSGRNPLVEMLARHAPRLPDWLGLVVTSRPESAVQTPLQGLNPFVLDTRTEANRADLRDYLRQKLAPQLHGRPDADRLIGQILEKSEGVFLYVERFCDDVQQNHLSLDRPSQFPQGLGGIFCQWFQRQFPDVEEFRKDVRPALRAILAAREPLPVEILQRLFHWQDEQLRDFTRTLGSLFPVTKETHGEVIKPYHKSIEDWLTSDVKAGEFFVSAKEGHRLLSDFCFAQWRSDSHFPISEVIHQLQFDPTPDRTLQVLRTPEYYERKYKECGLNRLHEDLALLASSPLNQSSQVPLAHCAPAIQAIFGIMALVSFGPRVSAAVTALRRFIESGCDKNLLEAERVKLKPQIASAESKPRIRRDESNHFAANTAHFYDDYSEHWLKAEDAAFSLNPAQLIECLKRAMRFQAIYSCDTDPIGAVNIAIQETAEEVNAKLTLFEKVAYRLNVGVSECHEAEGAANLEHEASPAPASSSKPIDVTRTYSGYGTWCDMVDYNGRGFPQDMDFVCRHCGYHEGVGSPNDVPPACPKCNFSGVTP